ncbi:MAG: hypothetical protein ACI82F_003980, partial [Planctomycetota bacterium]
QFVETNREAAVFQRTASSPLKGSSFLIRGGRAGIRSLSTGY